MPSSAARLPQSTKVEDSTRTFPCSGSFRSLLAFALFGVAAAPANAQSPAAMIEGLDAGRWRQTIAVVDRSGAPNGSDVYTAAFGESMTGFPRRPDTFRNGAMAFTYMSTLLLTLVDPKKVSLDTKLSTFSPDLPYADRITLKNLANMTSGYADYVIRTRLLQGLMHTVPSMGAGRAH